MLELNKMCFLFSSGSYEQTNKQKKESHFIKFIKPSLERAII